MKFGESMLTKRYLKWGGIVLVACVLSACSGDELNDLQAYMKEVEARNPGKIEPLPKVEDFEGYAYAAAVLKDPFQATFKISIEKSGTRGIGPDLSRKKQPLESFPLDGMRLMGSIHVSGERWALVKTPSSDIVRVRAGDYMGQNFGKIVRITEAGLELRELISDGLGGWEERMTSVALSE